jgi:hypothetical protein
MNPNPAPNVMKSDEEWKRQLTPEQFHVARQHGTERPFSSPLNREKRPGLFKCVCCGASLFSSSQLLGAGRQRSGERTRGALVADAPDRGPLCIMRRASRPCLSRWPQTDGSTLLHERRRVELCAERNFGKVIAAQPGFGGRQEASAVGGAAYELLSMCARNSAIEPNRTVPLGSSASIDPSA